MSVWNRVRACDKFGTSPTLKFDKADRYQTLGGGLASLCLKILILVYFINQLIEVVTYADPQISSYMISEDRNKMEEPLKFSDMSQTFYFLFIDEKYQSVLLDPRIGSFKVWNSIAKNKPDGSVEQKFSETPTKKVDFSTDDEDVKILSDFGTNIDYYKAADLSQIQVSGIIADRGLYSPIF